VDSFVFGHTVDFTHTKKWFNSQLINFSYPHSNNNEFEVS